MHTLRRNLPLHTSRIASMRTCQRISRHTYVAEPPPPHPPSTPPNPNSTPPEPSRAGAFYRGFGTPLLKCFLGALFTYQVAYWAWLKLEVLEEQFDKKNEIEGLKQELKEAVIQQKEKAREVAEGWKKVRGNTEAKAVAVREEVKKGGWWPW